MFHNEDNWPVDSSRVKSVDLYDDGGFAITQENGWTFGVTAEEAKTQPLLHPVEGEETITLGGFGHQIRGIFIGGREYRYVTRAEADKARAEWLANYEREKEERFYANVSDYIERKNALDKPFRDRIDRFANKGFKQFWTEDGGYELFAVEQANNLLRHAVNVEGVEVWNDAAEWLDKFSAANYDEQKAMWPGLDDGHSGNTFGAMVGLAKAVARGDSI